MGEKMNKNKAISYPLAIIILIAVAIAIGASFIGWIHTLWWSRQEPEILKIYPDTTIIKEGNHWMLKLHVRNLGSGTAEIYKIVIKGREIINYSKTIPPSQEDLLSIDLKEDYSDNASYYIEIYVRSGNIYNILTWVTKTT